MSSNRLFVYGTLMLDEVMNTLIDRIPDRSEEVAINSMVVRLPGRMYPGLVPKQGSTSHGLAYSGLTTDEWLLLDTFEDPAYDLVEVPVASGGVPALSYVWSGAHEGADWSDSNVSLQELADYVRRCRSWRRWYDNEGKHRPSLRLTTRWLH
ncbi:MAG: gamma-glutamylcyclotransferase family protein [Pseudonocardia sp.]